MAWGTAAYLKDGSEIVTTYTPYNLIKFVPIERAIGWHHFTVPELPAGSTMEYSIEVFHSRGYSGTPMVEKITLSGNKVSYYVNYNYANAFPYQQRPVFAIYARR